jgi:hypothetical protein
MQETSADRAIEMRRRYRHVRSGQEDARIGWLVIMPSSIFFAMAQQAGAKTDLLGSVRGTSTFHRQAYICTIRRSNQLLIILIGSLPITYSTTHQPVMIHHLTTKRKVQDNTVQYQ